MSRITMVSTLFGAMTAAAARDGGQLPAVPPGAVDVLLVANNAPIPEVADPVHLTAAGARLAGRWDRTVYLNQEIFPAHPSVWQADPAYRPVIARAWRAAWGLGSGPLELVVDSIQVPPAAALVRLFPDAQITVLSEGLMSYGPTRNPQPPEVAQRIGALIYLDLVPGLRPVLLSEFAVPGRPVPLERLRAVVEAVTPAYQEQLADLAADDAPTGLVLGQYLGALGLIRPEQEASMQVEMLRQAIGQGAQRVIFKAHPTAPPGDVERVERLAGEAGIAIASLRSSMPAEVLAGTIPLVGASSCFSTSLVTLAGLYGTPIASLGTARLLAKLRPVANSNRLPLVVIDYLTRPDRPDLGSIGLQDLVETVAYRMQPRTAAHLRPVAERTLALLPAQEAHRYTGVSAIGEIKVPRPPRAVPLPLWVKELVARLAPDLAKRGTDLVARLQRRP